MTLSWGLLSKYRNQIYGLSIIWIVIYHIYEFCIHKMNFSWISTLVFYNGYIGVDVDVPEVHFETENMKLYEMPIQKFCKKVVDEKWNLEKYFAICSYVPDDDARKCVRETFPNCLVYYP